MDILLWATGIASAFMICASAVYKLSMDLSLPWRWSIWISPKAGAAGLAGLNLPRD